MHAYIYEINILVASPTDNSIPSTSSSIGNSTPSTSTCTGNSTPSTSFYAARSNDTYVHGVGILAVLAIGVCVFFAYNTSRVKIKNLSMKNRINCQSDVIWFRSDDLYNKLTVIVSNCDCKSIKKPIGDGLLITTVAATAAEIFFGLMAVVVGQQGALLTSMLLVYLMSLPAFRSDDEKTYTIKWVALTGKKTLKT